MCASLTPRTNSFPPSRVPPSPTRPAPQPCPPPLVVRGPRRYGAAGGAPEHRPCSPPRPGSLALSSRASSFPSGCFLPRRTESLPAVQSPGKVSVWKFRRRCLSACHTPDPFADHSRYRAGYLWWPSSGLRGRGAGEVRLGDLIGGGIGRTSVVLRG